MTAREMTHAEGVRRLAELMRRVNSPNDLGDVLQEVANGVVEGLGYGVAAISRLEGDTLVMVAVAGPEEVREAIIGRRTPSSDIFDEFAAADQWGILRYVPHGRVPTEAYDNLWIPDFEPDDDPESWHPLDALYAPLYSADGVILGNMSVDLPPDNRIPNQEQRDLLEMFVVQAGLAFANAQQRERLAEQVRLGQALKEVALAGSLGDLDAVLAEAAAALHRGIPTAQVSIRCYRDIAENQVEHAAGFPLENPSKAPVPSLRGDLLAHVAQRGPRPIVVDVEGPGCELLPNSCGDIADLMTANGWARLVIAPLGAGAETLGYLGIKRTRDQPDFNQAELDAIHEASRELGRLVLEARVRETERRLVAELQEVDRYKGELIATISHELRTPLTSIVGHAEMLEDTAAPASSVAAITRNANRLHRLVDNLLNYVRVQDRREQARCRIDLVEVCRNTVEMLAIQAEVAGVELTLEAPDEKLLVVGDPEELPRAIDNICSNGVKYTKPGGSVVVQVAGEGDHAQVRVTDTGIGIAPSDQGRLFSAFHRSSNPEALTIPGTGLGLAIARRIAELHGGTIEVRSELGRGSTFTLRVPLPE